MAEPWVIVRTFDLKTGNRTGELTIRMDRNQRVWLAKHIIWAANNGKGVQVFNRLDQGKADAIAP